MLNDWWGQLCFKPEKQSRMGTLKRCARTPKKQGAHYSLSLKKFGIIILFRTRLWISKKWESFLEMWGCPTVPVQRVIYTSNVCLWKHIEKLGLCSFRKQDPAGSKGSQENLAWVCTLISSPRSKGRGVVNTQSSVQAAAMLWGCSPGFPYYCPSYRLQLCPDRMPVGHRLVIKNVLFNTMNVSLSTETKSPKCRGKAEHCHPQLVAGCNVNSFSGHLEPWVMTDNCSLGIPSRGSRLDMIRSCFKASPCNSSLHLMAREAAQGEGPGQTGDMWSWHTQCHRLSVNRAPASSLVGPVLSPVVLWAFQPTTCIRKEGLTFQLLWVEDIMNPYLPTIKA